MNRPGRLAFFDFSLWKSYTTPSSNHSTILWVMNARAEDNAKSWIDDSAVFFDSHTDHNFCYEKGSSILEAASTFGACMRSTNRRSTTRKGTMKNPILANGMLSLAVCALIFACAACATHKPSANVKSGVPSSADTIVLPAEPIRLAAPGAPAEIQIDEAIGRIELKSDAALVSAGRVMDETTFGDPALEMGAGGVRFGLAPFAAIAGAFGAGSAKLPPRKLWECESNLKNALTEAAAQAGFQERLLAAANQNAPRLLRADASTRSETILDAKLEKLSMERLPAGPDNFALHMVARVRLIEAGSGIVLFEQPFEFVSGGALFIDWSRHDALRSVADTGYRALAEHITHQLFSAGQNQPVLAGAGHKKTSPANGTIPAVIAGNYSPANRPAIEFAKTLVAQNSVRNTSGAIPVSDVRPVSGIDNLDIYAEQRPIRIMVQKPMVKDEAVPEAMENTEWLLDGLDNSKNSVVMLLATATAIPISLWQQASIGVRGLTEKDYARANSKIDGVIENSRISTELAEKVASYLRPHLTSKAQTTKIRLVELPLNESAVRAPEQIVANGLELKVVHAALEGDGEINPPLALTVEVEVNLLQGGNPLQCISFPVRYRGESRHFKTWAAHDARLFKRELDRCKQDLAQTIVKTIIERNLLPSDSLVYPALASRSE